MIFHGSSLIPTVIQLVGTIGSKSTFVVANTHANASVLSVAGQTDNNCMFNGTEAIVLEKNTVYIDKIGQVGILIVRGWAIPPSGSTDDMDLRRKYTVSMGDTAWANCQNEWDYFPNDSLANIGIYQNICGVDPDLNLSFANPVIAGGYFEFDIMATSTGANTYLDNSPIDIRYNSAVFGTHAVAGGRVTVTLGSSFNASTYLSPMFGIGDGVDSIAVGFSSDNSASSWNRTLITSTPIQLLHYKIQILNCGNSAGIQFFNQSFTTSFSWYVANANDNPNTATTFPYTNVNEGAALNTSIPPCTPAITDFNSPMRAGIGEILTITGSNFGSARGNGQVKFTNADNGGASYLQHLNATDYLNWSNTQIQITLPNFVDSIFPSPNQLSQISIGGGNFIVTTNAGDSIVSANNMAGNPFKIFYNLLQTRNNTAQVKKRINLTKSDTSGGYMFRLNPTDFPAGSNQRYVFTNAARDWRCMTGVNITIGPDITITYKPDSIDGINYVCFSNLLTISSALAKTTTHVFGCTNGVVANQETDMQFNNTASIFAYDTNATHNIPASQYDFYEVCSHEIGHVVGLAHNVVPTDLMFWSEGTGVTAANRKRLVAGSSPDSGGVYSVTKSISTPLGCWSVMSLGQCQNPNGINQYVNNSLFAIYPNPANDFITVEFRNPLNKETQIAIIDVLGHVVKQIRVQTTKTYIDIGNLSSGAYVIQINGSYTKLIKN